MSSAIVKRVFSEACETCVQWSLQPYNVQFIQFIQGENCGWLIDLNINEIAFIVFFSCSPQSFNCCKKKKGPWWVLCDIKSLQHLIHGAFSDPLSLCEGYCGHIFLGHGKYFEVGIFSGTTSDLLNSDPNIQKVQKNSIRTKHSVWILDKEDYPQKNLQMLCFVLTSSILCNLLCVRVLFENASSPPSCFRFFFSKLHCELCLVCIGLSDTERRNAYARLRIYLLTFKTWFCYTWV